MKITFLGTGESCDISRRNTSILIDDGGGRHLLDCGFSSAPGYFEQENDTPLNTIWISHFHGDHFFGVPQLLVYFYMQQREAPLTILSGFDCRDIVHVALELAYPGLLEKLPYPLLFITVPPGKALTCENLVWTSASVSHSQPAFSIRLSTPRHSVYYSGDGKPTVEAVRLMKGCDLVIHESFSYIPNKPTHASVEECLLLAAELDIPRLALLHMNRQTRKLLREMENPLQPPANTQLIIPEDNDQLVL
jgi:ribonuclease BN (tRNA processing enzyme)